VDAEAVHVFIKFEFKSGAAAPVFTIVLVLLLVSALFILIFIFPLYLYSLLFFLPLAPLLDKGRAGERGRIKRKNKGHFEKLTFGQKR
jgi:hypothetical protein